jgi:hypothetical protein
VRCKKEPTNGCIQGENIQVQRPGKVERIIISHIDITKQKIQAEKPMKSCAIIRLPIAFHTGLLELDIKT